MTPLLPHSEEHHAGHHSHTSTVVAVMNVVLSAAVIGLICSLGEFRLDAANLMGSAFFFLKPSPSSSGGRSSEYQQLSCSASL